MKEETAVTEINLIVDLNSIDAATQSMTGGKASNLTTLTEAGFKVPQGFVVTTEAYSKFIVSNQLESLAKEHLANVDLEDAGELSKATEAMRNSIQGSTLPEELIVAVTKAYKQHALGRVAIRSSATAEDLPDASFAGQYDTSLNIEGIENVLEHIKNCFGSMWTTRAVAYREENDIPHDQVQIAVVVQSMVDARCAGVLFTRNPISKLPDEMS
ncbi:MAG: phosphoenolpyruvate synthase, partial [Candidatus Thorarchaeota archaeon]|nr:phosphoenolpyruvate synthase [Candidatus Thorarchaeota archaeon]